MRARPAHLGDDSDAAARDQSGPAAGAVARLLAGVPAGATGVVIVDLARLRVNWRALADLIAPAECAAVVKADAYGLGAERVVPALLEAGCRSFFVATLQEAQNVRAIAPGTAIYVLDGALPRTEKDIAALCAIPVLSCLDEARAWVSLAGPSGKARPAAVHVDTGLNRLGMGARDVGRLADDAPLLRRLDLALIMSHLACADEIGRASCRERV